jgi:hypothetical protein
MAPLDLPASRVAIQFLRRFVLNDAGLHRLEGGEVKLEFMFAAELETEVNGRIRDMYRTRVMNALKS